MKSKGFSLVEVILVMGIIGVVGFVISNLLTRTYRTSSDADTISTLKRNGEIASTGLSEIIRMADGVVCYNPSTGPAQLIIIRDKAGKYTRFRFVNPTSTDNGYIAKQENVSPVGELNSFCLDGPVPNQEVALTDKNNNSGVSISNGLFSGVRGNEGKDTVTIKFDVGTPVLQGSLTKATIQTTVQVR